MSYHIFKKLERTPHPSNTDITALYNSSMRAYSEYVVTWYGELIPVLNKNQVKVKVYLVALSSEFYTYIEVPIEHIPKMPIGSIWKGGKSTEKLVISEDTRALLVMRDTNISSSIETNISYDNHADNVSSTKAVFDKHYHISSLQDITESQDITDKKYYPEFKDFNTLMVVPVSIENNGTAKQKNQHIIIHPLMFLNAHYGVSKKISRILINYLWGSQTGNPNDKTVINLLHLNYLNQDCPKAVYIPDDLVIGDAVFLYYLKNDPNTQDIVKGLNTRVRANFLREKRPFSYLKVAPYHTQPIHLECRYIRLDDTTLLCTEITGISMPQGENIYYDLKGSKIVKTNQTGSENNIQQVFRPLFDDKDNEEFYITTDLVNNTNRAVVRQAVRTIGDVRNLIKNENINLSDEVKRGKVIPIDELKPDNYSTGSSVGTDGKTGMLKVLIAESNQYDKNEYGVAEIDSQYEKLLKYAQYLKNNKRQLGYNNVQIDCYSFDKGNIDEIIKPIKFTQEAYPHSVYILRLQLDEDIFYFLDCESTEKNKSSGVAVKIRNETEFLDNNIKHRYRLSKLVNELGNNHGRLFNQTLDKFNPKKVKERQQLSPIISIAKYKHMNEETSNWVLKAIRKFDE